MTWFRHRGDTKFCTGAPSGGSFATLCHGRWPLTDVAHGLVESSENPPTVDRCGCCFARQLEIDAERAEVMEFTGYAITPESARQYPLAAKVGREILRLRAELEQRANELQVAERSLAEAQEQAHIAAMAFNALDRVTHATRNGESGSDAAMYGSALVEAIGIAQSAARRGLLSTREHDRLRELAKVVPQ
jgi:hypothetical protein